MDWIESHLSVIIPINSILNSLLFFPSSPLSNFSPPLNLNLSISFRYTFVCQTFSFFWNRRLRLSTVCHNSSEVGCISKKWLIKTNLHFPIPSYHPSTPPTTIQVPFFPKNNAVISDRQPQRTEDVSSGE